MAGYGLLLDLSHAGFAAVLDADATGVRASSARPAGTRHDDVAEWTEGLLRQAGGTFADLSWIAVGVGPGSFTGIRIAMAFAKGVALPHGIPVHGFTSFEALYVSAPSFASPADVEGAVAEKQLAVIPATAGRFYVSASLDDAGALVTAEELAARRTGFPVILTPEITPALRAAVGGARLETPGAAWDAVAIARHARASGRGLARPVYLQLSAAEEKFGAADMDANEAGAEGVAL